MKVGVLSIKFRGDFLQVYDQTLEHFSEREAENETPVHVINMNVVDNPEDATIGVLYCKIANVSNLLVIQFGLIPNFSKQIHLQGLLAV